MGTDLLFWAEDGPDQGPVQAAVHERPIPMGMGKTAMDPSGVYASKGLCYLALCSTKFLNGTAKNRLGDNQRRISLRYESLLAYEPPWRQADRRLK